MIHTGKEQLSNENEMQSFSNADLLCRVCITWGPETALWEVFWLLQSHLKHLAVFDSLCSISVAYIFRILR